MYPAGAGGAGRSDVAAFRPSPETAFIAERATERQSVEPPVGAFDRDDPELSSALDAMPMSRESFPMC